MLECPIPFDTISFILLTFSGDSTVWDLPGVDFSGYLEPSDEHCECHDIWDPSAQMRLRNIQPELAPHHGRARQLTVKEHGWTSPLLGEKAELRKNCRAFYCCLTSKFPEFDNGRNS